MEKMTLGLIVTFFMGAIVVLALMSPIAKETQYMTEKFDVSAEAHSHAAGYLDGQNINTSYELTVTNPPTGWEISACPISSVTITMPNGTALVDNTDYVLAERTGVYTLLSSDLVNFTKTVGGNWTNASYTFCGSGYITDTGGRAVANLILIMATLGLLGFAVWHVTKTKFT